MDLMCAASGSLRGRSSTRLAWIRGWKGEIQHIGPFDNKSGELEDKSFEPCAVLHDAWLRQTTPGPPGWLKQVYGSLTLWLPPEGAERAGWTT